MTLNVVKLNKKEYMVILYQEVTPEDRIFIRLNGQKKQGIRERKAADTILYWSNDTKHCDAHDEEFSNDTLLAISNNKK